VNSIQLRLSPFLDRSRYSVRRTQERKNCYELLTEDGPEVLNRKQDKKAQSEEKKRWNVIAVANRERDEEGVNL
jgi:hypothetical protein